MRRASRRAGDRFDAAECPVLNVLSITTPIGPMSLVGTFLPCQPRRAMSAIGGRPADICSQRGFLILTRSGHRPDRNPAVQQSLCVLRCAIPSVRAANSASMFCVVRSAKPPSTLFFETSDD
jgi:hypothetical protein